MCIEDNCKTHPVFNILGTNKGMFCFKHKKEDMVNVKNKICIYQNCSTQASYNIKGETNKLYCKKTKQ